MRFDWLYNRAGIPKSVSRLQAGQLGFNSWQGQLMATFLYIETSIPNLGSTQPPIWCILGPLSLGKKQEGCEADNSLPSTAKIKNAQSYTSITLICLYGMALD